MLFPSCLFHGFERTSRVADLDRPFVTLSYAQTLCGSVAQSREAGQMSISCTKSMRYTHKLRAGNEGILVGVGTVEKDDPSLTVRYGVEGSNPIPVVVDTGLRIPLSCKLISHDDCERPIVLAVESTEVDFLSKKNDLERAGCRVLLCPSVTGVRKEVNLVEALKLLKAECGMSSLMVEGGAKIITSFLAQHDELVDEVVVTISPQFVGGLNVMTRPLEGSDNRPFPKLVKFETDRLDEDIIVKGIFTLEKTPNIVSGVVADVRSRVEDAAQRAGPVVDSTKEKVSAGLDRTKSRVAPLVEKAKTNIQTSWKYLIDRDKSEGDNFDGVGPSDDARSASVGSNEGQAAQKGRRAKFREGLKGFASNFRDKTKETLDNAREGIMEAKGKLSEKLKRDSENAEPLIPDPDSGPSGKVSMSDPDGGNNLGTPVSAPVDQAPSSPASHAPAIQ